MHCNLRQPDAAQSISALISSPVSSLNSLSLSVAVLERFTADTLRYAVTFNFDPVTLTLSFDLEHCSVPAVPWLISVRNLSAIEQSAAELLQFEYLTL